MKSTRAIAGTLATLLISSSCNYGEARAQGAQSDAALIANAMSAAPTAVSRDATIIAFDERGQERSLRRGSGDFTCFPDNPATPGNDPMCFDRSGLPWARAWMMKQPPPSGQIGIAYMLQGSWAASNEDPHAAVPRPDGRWVETGPALMILNVKGLLAAYPQQPSDPARPFVMWPGTPYEHLMVPVASAGK